MSKGWACVVRLGGIGDNLIAASVCLPLKKLGYQVEFIASSPHHVVLQHNPNIDRLTVKVAERDLPQNNMDAWHAWMNSRANEYELFVHLSHSVEGRHALFPNMTSFWWSPEYRRELCAGSYIDTAFKITGVPPMYGPLYYSTEEERAFALQSKAKVGPRCVAWVLSGTRIDKTYPRSTMAIPRIIKECNVPVVMIGAGGKQASMAEAIRKDLERTNSSIEGLHLAMTPEMPEGFDVPYEKTWSVRRSLAFTQVCDVVVTPDTGFAWACAFEAMPKVVLLSHASADNITKHWVNTTTLHADPERVPCWPCHRLHSDPSTCVQNKEGNGAACISDISVERLVQAVYEALHVGS